MVERVHLENRRVGKRRPEHILHRRIRIFLESRDPPAHI